MDATKATLTVAGAVAAVYFGSKLLRRAHETKAAPPKLTRVLTFKASSVIDWIPRLATIFTAIDKSANGTVEVDELATFMKQADDSEEVRSTMGHLDLNEDGVVTFEEFSKYFMLLQTLIAPRRFKEMLDKEPSPSPKKNSVKWNKKSIGPIIELVGHEIANNSTKIWIL